MPTLTNTTDKKIVVRTGKDHTNYRFYGVLPHSTVEVSKKEAKAIAKKAKKLKIAGLKVSGFLKVPLKKPESKKEEVGASVEVVATEEADEERSFLGKLRK